MIIVSRDKKSIHNFDNILNIQIEKIDNTYKLIIYDEINDGSSLGEYRTEKRAKEVLQEIQERYEHTQYLKCFNKTNDLYEVGIKDFAYEMPEE